MMPFMTQPAVAPACYVPEFKDFHSLALDPARRLTRAFSAAGDRTKWTFDACAEINTVDREFYFLSTYNTYSPGNNYAFVRVEGGGQMFLYSWNGSSTDFRAHSGSQLFRSPGRYHVHVEYDSGHEKAAERLRVWVNGVRISLTFVTEVGPGGISDFNTAREHNVYGYHYGSTAYGNVGTGDRVAFISDAIVPVSDFGETNIHGVWVLKNVSVPAWGTNGFYLDFSDPLNPGKDVSGQGNHWTAMGFDATGKDSVASTPTNVYATLNPLDKSAVLTLSDGGLAYQGTSAGCGLVRSTLPLFDGVYWEATPVAGGESSQCHGIAAPSGSMEFASGTGMSYWYAATPHVFVNGAEVPVSGTYGTADTLGLAYRAGRLYFRKNGVWVIGDPETATGGLDVSVLGDRLYALHGDGTTYAAGSAKVNFGQRPFAYAPPVGFKPLCTDNLPEPDIKDPSEAFVQVATIGANMDALLNTMTGHGNGAPYVEIIKRRDASEDWRVRFSDDPGNAWATNNALAKAAAPALVSEGAYVGYRLRVGARYGVWTAEVPHTIGTATNVSHGLNTSRNAVIATRVSAGGGDRYFRHPDMLPGQVVRLNGPESSGAAFADSTITNFGADSFQIGSGAPSGIYRVMVLAQRDGFLDLASYTGNASADGPFCPLSVAPLFLLTKWTGADDCNVIDTARSPSNPVDTCLFLNRAKEEFIGTDRTRDLVVGGVKIRQADPEVNAASGITCVVAIGRPIGGICVAPATAR